MGPRPHAGGSPAVRWLVPVPRPRVLALPPLPEPAAHPDGDAGLGGRPRSRVLRNAVRAAGLLADQRVPGSTAPRVGAMGGRRCRAGLAAARQLPSIRVRASQLRVERLRAVVPALGDVALAARLGILVARRKRKTPGAVCARRPARRSHRGVSLPHRLPRVLGPRRLGPDPARRAAQTCGSRRADRRRRPPHHLLGRRSGAPRHGMDQPERLPAGHRAVRLVRRSKGPGVAVHRAALRLRAVPDHHAARLARDRGVYRAIPPRRTSQSIARGHGAQPGAVLRSPDVRPPPRAAAGERRPPAASLHHGCPSRRHPAGGGRRRLAWIGRDHQDPPADTERVACVQDGRDRDARRHDPRTRVDRAVRYRSTVGRPAPRTADDRRHRR